MNIGDLFFSLRADDKSLQADINRSAKNAGTTFGSGFKSAFTKQNIGKGLVQGLGLGGGLRVFSAVDTALSSTINFLGDANTAAADLSETINKSNVVFGDNAAEVLAWSEGTADAIGQSQAQALGAAATFGNLFATMGLGHEDAANMSTDLVELASDLASFNNIDPDIALEKLRSGLSGEAEPLRAMGVFLNEATVKAKAMELGLVSADGKLTESAKVQARYALILEQTTTAQGDFARTSDGLANTQRRQAAAMADLSAEVGEVLLPIITELAHFGVDVVIPFIRGVIKGIKDWAKENKPLLDTIGKIANILGKVLFPAIGLVADAIGTVAAPFMAAIGIILDFIGAIVDGGPKVGKAVGGIVGFITGIPGRIAGVVGRVLGVFADIGRGIVGFIRDGVAKVIEFILSIPGKIFGLIGKVGQVATDAAAALLAPFITVADKIAEIIRGIGGPQYTPKQHVDYHTTGAVPANVQGTQDRRERAWGGSVARGTPYLVGERGPEMFVPSATGAIRPLDGMVSGSAGGSRGGDINVNVSGLVKARDPFEIATQIRRVRDFIVVTPRTEPA